MWGVEGGSGWGWVLEQVYAYICPFGLTYLLSILWKLTPRRCPPHLIIDDFEILNIRNWTQPGTIIVQEGVSQQKKKKKPTPLRVSLTSKCAIL
jgi:hypothetical protein